MENTFIYLTGFPGTGKYTIAKEICSVTNMRLVDNHLINNPVFSLIETEGRKLPERVWRNIGHIWDVVFDTIHNLSPPKAGFVLTNSLYDDETDRAWYAKVLKNVEQRQGLFIPVKLTIGEDALLARRDTPERRQRLKCTNKDNALNDLRARRTLPFVHPNTVQLDVSDLTAEQAAKIILDRARKLKNPAED